MGERIDEGEQTLAIGGARTERRWAVQHRVLELAFTMVEQRHGQPRAIPEAMEDRALPHPGGAGDLLHGHAGDALLGEQPLCRVDDARPVAGGVRAFPG